MMTEGARRIALANQAREDAAGAAVDRARRDRDRLARLVREGVVARDVSIGRSVPGAATFRDDVERRVAARPRVDLAIRPNKKKRRR